MITWKSLKVVKFLQLLDTILGLSLPDLYNYNGLSVLYIIYGALLCALLTIVWIFGLMIRSYKIYPDLVITAIILDIFMFSSLSLTNIYFRISHIFIQRRKIVRLTKILNALEKKLQEKFQLVVDYHENKLKLQFFCFQTLVLTIILYDSIANINSGIFEVMYILPLIIVYYVQLYSVSLVTLQVHFYSIHVRCLIQFLHKNMQETLHPYSATAAISEDLQLMKYRQPDALFFVKKYDELCDVVDMINDAFGGQMFLIVVTITLNVMHGLNLVLKIFLKMQIYDFEKPHLIVTSVLNIIEYSITGILLSITCDKTANEIDKTSIISYRILMNYPSCPRNAQERIVKDELRLLSERITRRKIRFSTGFFVVDYTMLFMIFGSIATYLVIVLQFK